MSVFNWVPERAVSPRIGQWLRSNLANRRSRLLLAALALTLAAGGLMALDSADTSMQRTLVERRQLLARIENLGDGELWHRRRAETDLARVQAETRLWEAETDGLAQANFQSWILDQATRSGIAKIEIHTSIGATASKPLNLRQLTAEVTGGFAADSMSKLLEAIARHDRLLVIKRLEILTSPYPRFEMLVSTFLRPGPRG
jgi:hypothetical protein